MSSRGGPRLLVAAASLGLVVGLAACTPDEPEPTPTASMSPEPTETPSPTPTLPPEAIAPERPAAMDEISVAGAEAAATYFLELYPYTYATGDLTEWTVLSHPECIFCQSVIGNVTDQIASGHTASGGGLAVQSIEGSMTSEDFYFVEVVGDQAPGFEYAADGTLLESSEALPLKISVALVPSTAGFQVREVEVETLQSTA